MMNAIVNRRPVPTDDGTRRLVLRMNGMLFHCLGMALLLESQALACARSTGPEGLHVREREERTRWLRSGVAQLWPEFAWNAAFDEFDGAAVPQPEVAARCAALIFTAVSCWADDPALRAGLHAMAEAGRRHASSSSSSQPRVQARKQLAWSESFLSLRRAGALREPLAARAFQAMQKHWTDSPPFDMPTHADFLRRFEALAASHARPGWKQRLLLWARMRAHGAARSPAPRLMPVHVRPWANDEAATPEPLPHAAAVR